MYVQTKLFSVELYDHYEFAFLMKKKKKSIQFKSWQNPVLAHISFILVDYGVSLV